MITYLHKKKKYFQNKIIKQTMSETLKQVTNCITKKLKEKIITFNR